MTLSGIPIQFSLLIMLCFFLCLYRAIKGPTSADRILAIDTLGVFVVCFCVLSAIYTKRAFLMDIAISWGILGFIGTLALAKYLEGKNLDE